MWYVITAGAGLALGLGLLIWGLRERSKRHTAERALDLALAAEVNARRIADQNAVRADVLENHSQRLDEELGLLRARLKVAYERLVKTNDPEAIRSWLDDELKGGEV